MSGTVFYLQQLNSPSQGTMFLKSHETIPIVSRDGHWKTVSWYIVRYGIVCRDVWFHLYTGRWFEISYHQTSCVVSWHDVYKSSHYTITQSTDETISKRLQPIRQRLHHVYTITTTQTHIRRTLTWPHNTYTPRPNNTDIPSSWMTHSLWMNMFTPMLGWKSQIHWTISRSLNLLNY